jgi:hypothetical protein
MRYINDRIKYSNDGKEVYVSKLMANIPDDINDIYIRTTIGDRLDIIASTFYNDASLWWIIAEANNIHDAPIGLRPGIVLRIPVNYRNILQANT